MNEKVKLEEFDLLGIIQVMDVHGIESYVTPVVEDGKIKTYLSRSKEYYNVKSMTELSNEREELKKKLTNVHDKRNFVILENMLNCSAKVYFKNFEQYIKTGKTEAYLNKLLSAQSCFLEDTRNIIALLSGKGSILCDVNNILPSGLENSERRFIEMDNKAMLYIFVQAVKELDIQGKAEVLTPGYGSIYMGPFFKIMCGYDFTNMLKSKYIDDTVDLSQFPLESLLSSERIFESERKVLLLDDNIGTGSTMAEIKRILNAKGKREIISGAVQYNWRNYRRVSQGEKTDIERFEVDDYEILTPINYAGHKLYKHAVDALNSSGEDYTKYLNSKDYRISRFSDLIGTFLRGINWAAKANMDLLGIGITEQHGILEKYKDSPRTVNNPFSKKMIELINNKFHEISGKSEHEESFDID